MGRLVGVLTERGPMVDIKLMLTSQRVEALKRAGAPYSSPMTVRGLVDTGASGSAVDRHLVTGLALDPRGVTYIHTPSTGSAYVERNQYDVCMVLGEDQDNPLALNLPVIEAEFASQGFLALIGRDVLSLCVLTYNGPAATFTLEWGDQIKPTPRKGGRR